MHELSPIQDQVVNILAERGFGINDTREHEGDDWPTVYMSKRVKSYSTRYAEVDGLGFVNGDSLQNFLKSF